MKRALVLSLVCIIGLAAIAFAGPTVQLQSLWYDGDQQLALAFGGSYVPDRAWGGFGEFKLAEFEYVGGDGGFLHIEGVWDFQVTYDIDLFQDDDDAYLTLRPGFGIMLPSVLHVEQNIFDPLVVEPGLAVSLAVITVYDFQIRGEMYFNGDAVGWALGGGFDFFGLSELFRRPAEPVGDEGL